MKISTKDFIFSLLFCFLPTNICANDITTNISYSQQKMDSAWSFLPDVPSAFKDSTSSEIAVKIENSSFYASLADADFDLKLSRITEPKNVDLQAQKRNFKAGYKFNESSSLFLLKNFQDSKSQSFDCYGFGSFIIGYCSNADININFTNSKYEALGDKIIKINGKTKSTGLGYKREIDLFGFYEASFVYLKTEYSYDWISPVEEIDSPFILGLSINGVTLENAINESISKLPQRDKWRSHQLELSLKQKIVTFNNLSFISNYDLVSISFADYKKIERIPNFNVRFRLGLEYSKKDYELLFYGDIYKNNLIGFEPITFNQRTESYFNKSFGEIGISLSMDF